MKRVGVGVAILLSGCIQERITTADLRRMFSQPEYVASTDGWAEARRRRLLAKYLRENKITVWETAALVRGKYNRVVLHAGRADAPAQKITLSLLPGPHLAARQAECDRLLFAFLDRRFARADFVATETCLGLTSHDGDAD